MNKWWNVFIKNKCVCDRCLFGYIILVSQCCGFSLVQFLFTYIIVFFDDVKLFLHFEDHCQELISTILDWYTRPLVHVVHSVLFHLKHMWVHLLHNNTLPTLWSQKNRFLFNKPFCSVIMLNKNLLCQSNKKLCIIHSFIFFRYVDFQLKSSSAQ